jgi:hypothetical protein
MGAYTFLNGKKLKFWKVEVASNQDAIVEGIEIPKNGTVVIADQRDGLFIKTKDGNEPPHLFFNYGRCDLFHIRDIYVKYIIDKYVSDICKGLEHHLNKKLTKLDTLYLKANIKECKLYWAVKSKYDVGESILNDIISKYCYENDNEKFLCKSFKRN